MALFKVKIQQTIIQEGVVEAASAEEIKREAETNNNISWWALRVHQTTNSVVEEVVELEEKAGE
jgi:hypothetical protein